MVIDTQTNLLYLADCLPQKYPTFFTGFERVLKEAKVNYTLLSGAKDPQVLDYMPVQVTQDQFVQFHYFPYYLGNKEQEARYVAELCQSVGAEPVKTDIIIDGSNIVRYEQKAITTERVFRENKKMPVKKLIDQLKNFLQVEQITFIPEAPDDFSGQSDSMLRFVNGQTLLVHNFESDMRKNYRKNLLVALNNIDLEYREMPHASDEPIMDSIHYLQMSGCLFAPVFGNATDNDTLRFLQHTFPEDAVYPVDCTEIARDNLSLHAIGWNILR